MTIIKDNCSEIKVHLGTEELENNIDRYNQKLLKYRQFSRVWVDDLDKLIRDLITVSKNYDQNLTETKKYIESEVKDILDSYHVRERYSEIKIDNEVTK